MNPAMSVSFAVCGLITCARALLFILAEMVAAIAAMALFKELLPSDFKGPLPVTRKSTKLTVAQEFIWELLVSTFLVFVYLACIDLRQHNPQQWMSWQFGQGFLYTVMAILYSVVSKFILLY